MGILAVLTDVSLADRLSPTSLQLSRGVTAVVGPSGAGKTSLLNLLAGYEKPDRGDVSVKVPVAWVPQKGGLWPGISVLKHLDIVAPDAATDDHLALLDAFDLKTLADRMPDSLSLGEQGRLAVARALASPAPLLIMDEPLSHVDAGRHSRYWQALQSRIEADQRSLVFASHDAETVLAESESVWCVHRGTVHFTGDTDTLYHEPTTRLAAESLGLVNWFPREDAAKWFGRAPEKSVGLRPEQIQLIPREDGPLEILRTRSGGGLHRVLLQHRETGSEKVIFHRFPGQQWPAGQRVILQQLSLFLLLCALSILTGCGGPSDPLLEVGPMDAWPVPASGGSLPAPRSVAVTAAGETIVLDNAGRVLVMDENGEVLRSWSMPDSEVGKPEGITCLEDGRIIVCDTHYHQVLIFDSSGKVVQQFGKLGEEPSQFIYPVAVTTDPAGNLYIGEYGGNDRVQVFDRQGQFLRQFGGFGMEPGDFQRPSGLVWHEGKVYVADAINNRIQVFTEKGSFIGILRNGASELRLHFPYDLAEGPADSLFVIEYGAGRLTQISREGRVLGRIGQTGSQMGQFVTPWGVAFGNDGRLRVADTGNRRVVTFQVASSKP
ncbi:MAG: ATP-binding cassette domain-containing protein [Verrucomicrobiota bacterium]